MDVEPGDQVRTDDGDWREIEVVLYTELPAGGHRTWIFTADSEQAIILDDVDPASSQRVRRRKS